MVPAILLWKKKGCLFGITYKPSLNANALKIIAVTAMIVDHTTFWLVQNNTLLYVILRMFGRFAAPIMCYLISEGYFHTSIRKNI